MPFGLHAYGCIYQAKCQKGSPSSNFKGVLSLLPCRESLGSIYVCAEKAAAGRSSCSPLLIHAPPPQLSTSSATFSKLGALIVYRQSIDKSEKEISHRYEPHVLSSPAQNKSFKKVAITRLGKWSNTQREGMRARFLEASAIYRILICPGNM